MNKLFLLVPLLLFFSLLFACTETIPGVPVTASQIINKITDLNYTKFVNGDYNNMFLIIDNNKISVLTLDINSYDINWSQLVSFPAGCGSGEVVKIVGSSLVCVPMTVDTNWQTSWSVFDANMKAEYNLPAIATVDTNTETALQTSVGEKNKWINYFLIDKTNNPVLVDDTVNSLQVWGSGIFNNVDGADYCAPVDTANWCWNYFGDQAGCESSTNHNGDCTWDTSGSYCFNWATPDPACYGATTYEATCDAYGADPDCGFDPYCFYDGVSQCDAYATAYGCSWYGGDGAGCVAVGCTAEDCYTFTDDPTCSGSASGYCAWNNADYCNGLLQCNNQTPNTTCDDTGGLCSTNLNSVPQTVTAGQYVQTNTSGAPLTCASTATMTGCDAQTFGGGYTPASFQPAGTYLTGTSYPLTTSGTTAGLAYNTTNLKNTANQLNTIQDISTTSSPTFNAVTASNGANATLTAQYTGTNATRYSRLVLDNSGTGFRDYTIANYMGNGNLIFQSTTSGVAGTTFASMDGNASRMRIGDATAPSTDTLEVAGTLGVSGTSTFSDSSRWTDSSLTYLTNGATRLGDDGTSNIYKKYFTNEIVERWDVNNFSWTIGSAGTLASNINLGTTHSVAFTTYGSASGSNVLDGTVQSSAIYMYGGAGQINYITTGGNKFVATSTSGINRWVFVRSGSGITFYKNGVNIYSTTTSGDFGVDRIGGGASGFRGIIDEVVLSTTAWTQAQITTDYEGGLIKRYQAGEAGVTNVWHCDEGSGVLLTDNVGANTITFTAGTFTQNKESNATIRRNANLLKSYSSYNFETSGTSEIGDSFANTNIRGLTTNVELPITNNVSVLNTTPYKITPDTNGGTFASSLSKTYNVVAVWTEGITDNETGYIINNTALTYYIKIINGVLKVRLNNVEIYSAPSGDMIKRHRWVFILGGMGNTQLAIFKDGVSVYSAEVAQSANNAGWTKFACGSSGNETTPFPGTIDDFQLWSTNTQADIPSMPGDGSVITIINSPWITTDYASGKGYYWTTADTTDPTYNYHIDEGSGTTIVSSNNANTITFGTAPTWSTSTMSRNLTTTTRNLIKKIGETDVNSINTFVFGDLNVNTRIDGNKIDLNGNTTINGNIYADQNIQAKTNYISADGTAGFTGTCTILGLTSITVKNGLIVSCS